MMRDMAKSPEPPPPPEEGQGFWEWVNGLMGGDDNNPTLGLGGASVAADEDQGGLFSKVGRRPGTSEELTQPKSMREALRLLSEGEGYLDSKGRVRTWTAEAIRRAKAVLEK